MEIIKRLKEVEEGLRPVLDELGLECRAERHQRYDSISFVRPGEAEYRSVVQIRFPDEHHGGSAEPCWGAGSYVSVTQVCPQAIGTNGWIYHELTEWELWEASSPATAAALVSEMLRVQPLYPSGNVATEPNSHHLIEVWEKLETLLTEEYEVTHFDLSRDAYDNESIRYSYGDSIIELVYSCDAAKVAIVVDDEEVHTCGSCPDDVMATVHRTMWDLWKRFDP